MTLWSYTTLTDSAVLGGSRLVRSSCGRSEDLSGAGRRKHRKTCVLNKVVRARIRPFPRPPLARLDGTPLVKGAISVAEADGNRTRRRAFARPPVLKACPTLALSSGL
jgi:hypothetical protein